MNSRGLLSFSFDEGLDSPCKMKENLMTASNTEAEITYGDHFNAKCFPEPNVVRSDRPHPVVPLLARM
jgi:hypothetical protein